MGIVEDRRGMKPSQGDPKVDSLAEDLREVQTRFEAVADLEGPAVTTEDVSEEAEPLRPQGWQVLVDGSSGTKGKGSVREYVFAVHVSTDGSEELDPCLDIPNGTDCSIMIDVEIRFCDGHGLAGDHPLFRGSRESGTAIDGKRHGTVFTGDADQDWRATGLAWSAAGSDGPPYTYAYANRFMQYRVSNGRFQLRFYDVGYATHGAIVRGHVHVVGLFPLGDLDIPEMGAWTDHEPGGTWGNSVWSPTS